MFLKKIRQKGFTLVEIMLVIAIISTLVALAVPNVLRARINGNETSAIASCRAIYSACQTYYTYGFEDSGRIVHEYPESLADLAGARPPYLDDVLAQDTPQKQGYEFTYDFDRDKKTNQTTFTLNADPLGAFTGKRHFFVDVTGVIRANPTKEATENDLPIE